MMNVDAPPVNDMERLFAICVSILVALGQGPGLVNVLCALCAPPTCNVLYLAFCVPVSALLCVVCSV